MNDIVKHIDKRLEYLLDKNTPSNVLEAMKYSTFAGGKRIRPLLFCIVLESYNIDYMEYLDIACAIEMVHTYSLIHDDLPGMDDDNMRRGRPTCHCEFDEATAILAGDGLLNEAMNVILNSDINDTLKLECLTLLFGSSGINGMIYGQILDMEYENKKASIDILRKIHNHKTGALISSCFMLASNIVSKKDIDRWKEIGLYLGLAFQIQDDILDVTSTSEILGKPASSDIKNQKSTYVTLLSIHDAQELVNDYFNKIKELVKSLDINHIIVLDLINSIEKRVK